MFLFFLKVYDTELEKVDPFNGFQDFCDTFFFHRGKKKSKENEEETVVGEFKVGTRDLTIIPRPCLLLTWQYINLISTFGIVQVREGSRFFLNLHIQDRFLR